MDKSSLSHTKWNCTYHIVFIPKYRRKVMYGAVREDIIHKESGRNRQVGRLLGIPL